VKTERYKGLSQLRCELNKFMPMGEFLEEATRDLSIMAQEISGGKAVPALQSTVAQLGCQKQYDADVLRSVKEEA